MVCTYSFKRGLGGVGEVVGGVVFSLTQLDLVELVVSSLTEWYTSERSELIS